MGYHKLHYRTEFQGLPISVENRKGSKRRWYDPHNKTEGVTVMKFPYGYVRGTLGTDGDEVDVYIGPNKSSSKVFVVTQNKAPDFVKVDEQKVMLGFDSSKQARLAYLAHYNDKRFFRNIKEITIDEFKDKLAGRGGKLIKGELITSTEPDKIGESTLFIKSDLSKRFRSEAQRKYMYAAADRGEISRDTVEEFSDKTPKGKKLPKKIQEEKSMTTAAEEFNEITKALTARIASSVANRARMQARVDAYEKFRAAITTEEVSVPEKVGAGQEQPMIGTSRERTEGEPPVVPVRSIHNTVEGPTEEPTVYKSCGGCGRMCKSICHTCSNKPNFEATPIWRR